MDIKAKVICIGCEINEVQPKKSWNLKFGNNVDDETPFVIQTDQKKVVDHFQVGEHYVIKFETNQKEDDERPSTY